MSTIKKLTRYFQKYITITGLSGETYTYKARSDKNYPIVDYVLHKEKCKLGSWLYIAVDGNSDLNNLDNAQKLYLGSQTQDRMFRGDGLKGKNFHHQEMRNGNGQNNLEEFLQKRRTVEIYIISKDVLERVATEAPELKHVAVILADNSLKKYANHPAYWYEQFILSEEKLSWSWNQKGADSKAQEVIRRRYSST